MKLLMISTDRKVFDPTSAVALRQIEYAKSYEEVRIIVLSGKEFGEISLSPNCWVYSSRSTSKWLSPFDAVKLGRFIIERRGITDITCQDAFLTGMAGISLKKQFNLPLELQIHTDIGSSYFTCSIGNRVRKFLALNYLPKADSIRVVSERIKNYLIRNVGIAEEKIAVRPIFVDVDRIKNTPIIESADLRRKYPQFERIVLMASRLEPEKDIELAIRAWTEVVKKFPKAGLVIVGEGSLKRRLVALVGRLGLNGSIVFESWAGQDVLISYYKTTDLFLNTSLYEGYGMTLVEAHAAGCPMISTDVGVAREVGARITGWTEGEVAGIVSDCIGDSKNL